MLLIITKEKLHLRILKLRRKKSKGKKPKRKFLNDFKGDEFPDLPEREKELTFPEEEDKTGLEEKGKEDVEGDEEGKEVEDGGNSQTKN